MTQLGHALDIQRRWEDVASLKAYLWGRVKVGTIKELVRELAQTTTAAAVELEEPSGETIHDIEDANKALEVWQKTDQAGTDKDAVGTVEWQSSTGVITEATFALDHTNTTTHVPLVDAVTTARFLRSFKLTALNCADEVLIGNVAGSEIFGAIKVGYHHMLKTGLRAAPSRRTFFGGLHMELSLKTAAVTVVVTFTPAGETLTTTKNFKINTGDSVADWDDWMEVEPGSDVHWTVIDDNVAHPVATVRVTYVEGY